MNYQNIDQVDKQEKLNPPSAPKWTLYQAFMVAVCVISFVGVSYLISQGVTL